MNLLLVSAVALLASTVPAQPGQTTFEFHSDFWVNLHHTLYNLASVDKIGHPPDLSGYSSPDAEKWKSAIAYYEAHLIDKNLLDPTMIRIEFSLVGAGNDPALGSVEFQPALREVLESAAPVYRAHFWPEHNRRNHMFIQNLVPLISDYESVLKAELTKAYQTPWQKGPIRVEVSYYVTQASAYTVLRPTVITISSSSRRIPGVGGLECIFHEAGHAMVRRTADAISAEAQRQHKKLKYRNIWHAVIFYNSGYFVKRHLPGLQPYAEKYGLWSNAWPGCLQVFDSDWRPYLEGKTGFKDAVEGLVRDLDGS